MYTSAEIALLRAADPGVVIPGIDTAGGDPLATASLKPVASISGGAFYVPSSNEVIVNQAGAVLTGYNFGTATVCIEANNVTIKDSSFQAGPGEFFSIVQEPRISGSVIENNTFNGGSASNPLPMAAFINGEAGSMSVLNNSFLNSPGNAIDIEGGTVSGNFISGGGYSSAGKHPDMIWVPATTGALAISNNFVDATWAAGATGVNNGETTYALMLTLFSGNISNVNVSNNILLGGTEAVYAVGSSSTYHYSNVNITGNYLGFGQYGAFYPGTAPGVSEANNTIFDYTNPMYSQGAWASYEVRTQTVVTASASTQNIYASSSGTTTLYGGWSGDHLFGSSKETVFIGGAGVQYLMGGSGANIFTYLATSDSNPQGGADGIGNFDPAKDVIDLSAIDANPATTGVQNFTFIGTAAFTGAGAQVRFQQDPASNQTLVEATMAGDSSPDLDIRIGGVWNLTAANFALTAAQSTADLAAGAALQVSATHAAVGSAVEDAYTNVQGKSYSSYTLIYAGGLAAEDFNLNSSSNQLDLYGSALTINRGSGAESAQVGTSTGTSTFSLGYHSNETIDIGGAGAETFGLGRGFGNETITGFAVSGSNADTINFATSAFSYLNSGMTQAQDLAAVLAHATSSSSSVVIRDTSGDILTLNGLTAASITTPHFHFA